MDLSEGDRLELVDDRRGRADPMIVRNWTTAHLLFQEAVAEGRSCEVAESWLLRCGRRDRRVRWTFTALAELTPDAEELRR